MRRGGTLEGRTMPVSRSAVAGRRVSREEFLYTLVRHEAPFDRVG
jgi:hypothetical protein